MITIKYYDDLVTANIDRELLEEKGIKAFILNENSANVIPISYANPSLRPYIAVSENELKQAVEILGIEPPCENNVINRCPYCGSEKLKFGFRRIKKNSSKNLFSRPAIIFGALFKDLSRGRISEIAACARCGKEIKGHETER